MAWRLSSFDATLERKKIDDGLAREEFSLDRRAVKESNRPGKLRTFELTLVDFAEANRLGSLFWSFVFSLSVVTGARSVSFVFLQSHVTAFSADGGKPRP